MLSLNASYLDFYFAFAVAWWPCIVRIAQHPSRSKLTLISIHHNLFHGTNDLGLCLTISFILWSSASISTQGWASQKCSYMLERTVSGNLDYIFAHYYLLFDFDGPPIYSGRFMANIFVHFVSHYVLRRRKFTVAAVFYSFTSPSKFSTSLGTHW